jgi:hypothetical protein
MERKNFSDDNPYRNDEIVNRDFDDVRGVDVDDVRGVDEERARNREMRDEPISQSDEDLQREGNLGNERNRNEPDSESRSRR